MVRTNSLALALIAAANAEQVVYTVPAGRRTIVRSATLKNVTGAPISAFVAVRRAGTSHFLAGFTLTSTPGGDSALWLPYLVMIEADELRFQASAANALRVSASGPELVV